MAHGPLRECWQVWAQQGGHWHGQGGQRPSLRIPAGILRVTKIRSPLPADSTSWNAREKGRQNQNG